MNFTENIEPYIKERFKNFSALNYDTECPIEQTQNKFYSIMQGILSEATHNKMNLNEKYFDILIKECVNFAMSVLYPNLTKENAREILFWKRNNVDLPLSQSSYHFDHSPCHSTGYAESSTESKAESSSIIFSNSESKSGITTDLFNYDRNNTSKLCFTAPPQHGKSLLCSIVFPAFLLAINPKIKIILFAHTKHLAEKQLANCKRVMKSSFYQKNFSNTIITKKCDRKNEFETTEGGGVLVTSMRAGAIGCGGEFIIIDDPHNPNDVHSKKKLRNANEYFENVVRSRASSMTNGKAGILLSMQRLHKNDLVGSFSKLKNWKFINFQIKSDEKKEYNIFGKKVIIEKEEILNKTAFNEIKIENLLLETPSHIWWAQYMQKPLENIGSYLKDEHFNKFNMEFLEGNSDGSIIHSIDTATTQESGDYTVCTTWKVICKNYYLIDLVRKQIEYPELKNLAFERYKKYGGKFLIEDYGNGGPLIKEMQSHYIQTFPIKPTKNKIERLIDVMFFFQNRNVFIPNNSTYTSKATGENLTQWVDIFTQELISFPNCKNDDQVDSTTQFLNWIKDKEYIGNEDYQKVSVTQL